MTPADQRTVLVTGGASGIGFGVAEGFSKTGASVVIFDIDQQLASERASALSGSGHVIAIGGDVSQEVDVRSAVDKTVKECGSIDVLINNAGIEVPGRVPDLAAEDWDRQIRVNLGGAFLFSKYVIPYMRARRCGVIINISSVHAFFSYSESAGYDSSKAGMIALTRALAIDHGREGIRVNAICPGYIDTPLTDTWLATFPDREEVLHRVRDMHPLGRIGTPRDIAEAALFLASDAASFISGSYLVVDGGMSASGH